MSDLNENTEYIEAYFTNQLNDAEKRQFEDGCLTDESFAKEVAVFVTVDEGIRQKLLQQKQQEWRSASQKSSISPVKKAVFIKWVPYAAAACLLIVAASYFLFRADTPHQLANTYVKQHLIFLSQTMDASKDSLQQGIAAYNNQDYNKALQIFENTSHSHPGNMYAKKYTGLVYLVTKDYERALRQFSDLAGMKDAYRNPGLFLKALTLLERNKKEDRETARRLLEQVVKEKTEGSREAAKWLKEWH